MLVIKQAGPVYCSVYCNYVVCSAALDANTGCAQLRQHFHTTFIVELF